MRERQSFTTALAASQRDAERDIATRKSLLAKQTPLGHNAIMTESPVFMTDVVKDIGNPNRFRWNIYENKRVRDKSFYSFATRREAQSDAEKFVASSTRFGQPQKNKKPANSRWAAGCRQRRAGGWGNRIADLI